MPRPTGQIGAALVSRGRRGVQSLGVRHNINKFTRERRQFFAIPRGQHIPDMRQNADQARVADRPHEPEYWYRHLGGDVQSKPEFNYTYNRRHDDIQLTWRKQGKWQLHQVGNKYDRFLCQRCGYVVRSHLFAIKDDNWDHRACYRCYSALRATQEESEDIFP